MIKVFVYGTLKKGESNHILLAGNSMFVSENAIKGELFDLGPFPALKEGDRTIFGEVYIVGPNVLEQLDKLEGHPTFYKRKMVPLLFSMEKGDEAYAYFYEQEFHHVVKKLPEGVWKRNVKFGA